MNKILLILQREFLTRVRKKSFIIMTLLGPVLFAAFMIVPIWLATQEDKEVKVIAVADSSHLFVNAIPPGDFVTFVYPQNVSMDTLKNQLLRGMYYGILYIPHNIFASENVLLYTVKQPSLSTRMYIANTLKNMLQDAKLIKNNIPPDLIRSIRTSITVGTVRLTEEGKEKRSSSDVASIVGYAGGFLIYFFVFLFGSQVMRGVIEEKTNRIVEVIVSSVKPFQLMMGKIIGIALTGLVQFILWVVISLFLYQGAQQMFFPQLSKTATQQALAQNIMESGTQKNITETPEKPMNVEENAEAVQIFEALRHVNYPLILGTFIFFFLGGYLLYAAMFAAIGSAVDSETDTQQFMLPITVPLIIAIFVMIKAMNDPDSSVSFWFSIIPFTSPVVMMTRIPFGVPAWQLILSMFLLVITFIFMTWLAAKIYRTGILMYGKKVNWGELWKWIKYAG
ncbi:MAG: ABC transporter permease [Bacteroidales bacterium]